MQLNFSAGPIGKDLSCATIAWSSRGLDRPGRFSQRWYFLVVVDYGVESAEALTGGFPYLARQSGEQSRIGFQPVSSVDYAWLAVLAGPPISDCLDENRSRLVVRYRLEAYATLRRGHVAAGTRNRLQEDFHTSRASPESKVA